jgi:periplasmic divalent cation tolerance protein
MAEEILLALSTFPDAAIARKIGRALVTEHFAACANIVPEIESIYFWQNKVESSGEALAFFKITAAQYAQFEKRLRELHPYDVPEIIAFPVTKGLPKYLEWVAENCRS